MSTTAFELDCDVVFEFPLECARAAMSISQITPTLFLSSADAAQNKALVSRKGINPHHQRHPDAHVPRLPGGGVPACARLRPSRTPPLGDHFERVAERIHSNRTGNTLVYCAAGMSRSPSLVMAYLMRYKGTTLREAHRWVQDSRPYIRPNAGFWHQLLDYEKKLYGKNTVKVAPSLESNSVKEPITWSFNRSQGRSRYCMYQ
ncbi:hypothetical protein SKAU_G00206500 [Synaphobranchus kaupii]|uniref:Protein-tyrosine-phosphatase n=1 Tax=Synaphobranchus kaupii TaxID=118154 RepID=A0A9Q1FGG0_SYNKA|nr:hypothetical protein SKAU_G00206500 [Synaphobranchus kaupii]